MPHPTRIKALAIQAVLKVVDDQGAPKKMSPAVFMEFLQELIDDLEIRLEAARDEAKDLARR